MESTGKSSFNHFNKGDEDEKRQEWNLNDNDTSPRLHPPFMLENDILTYVNEIESVLSITQGENLDIFEKRFRGLNSVLARIVKENRGYIDDIEVLCSEGGDSVMDEYGRILREGGIEPSDMSLEAVLPSIKNLVDEQWGYVMVYGEVFHVRKWWSEEGKYGLYPGVVVLYELWVHLNSYIEKAKDLFSMIGHTVKDVAPADVRSWMMADKKESDEKLDKELNRPIYTVTGIRHCMGANLSEEEKTAKAERFLCGLKKGQEVVLVAEPDNPADPNAIAAYMDYKHIGYIARENTEEVLILLDSHGRCKANVEMPVGHGAFYVSIPGAPNNAAVKKEHPRQLPASPLGEEVWMSYTEDERALQTLASDIVAMKVNKQNAPTLLQMAQRYMPFARLSLCHDDTQWRDKILKMLYKICQGPCFTKQERELAALLGDSLSEVVGDMRNDEKHLPEHIFSDHLDRLREDGEVSRHLYSKYCDVFLNGKDFTDASYELLSSEYDRLRGWLKAMKWKQLRNPDDVQEMATKVYHLNLSRRELYDLLGVLLIMEKLREAMAQQDKSTKETDDGSRESLFSYSDDTGKKIRLLMKHFNEAYSVKTIQWQLDTDDRDEECEENSPVPAAEDPDDDADGHDGQEDLDFEAPSFNLKKLLRQPWFEESRTDERFDAAWTDAFVEDLMASEHGENIARDWYNGGKLNKCAQIKGFVLGLLKKNGVLKGSNDAIAKKVNLMENPRSFSKYMSRCSCQEYAHWVRDYVKQH